MRVLNQDGTLMRCPAIDGLTGVKCWLWAGHEGEHPHTVLDPVLMPWLAIPDETSAKIEE